MANLPLIKLITSTIYPYQYNDVGNLSNSYNPLHNLIKGSIRSFTTPLLNFDLEHPVDILIQDAYDGAVNLIINDGKNPTRLINSRFSVQDNNTFLIPDHVGFEDTNLYDNDTFSIDTRLKSICTNIPTLKYDGMSENAGNMPCGSYSFYFKLCDADDNETEVILESGVV